MHLENTFRVPVPVDVAWDTLQDYPRLARCMPGATVTAASGDDVLGQVRVKLGPVAVTYQGKVTVADKDRAACRIVAAGAGREARGSGTASARIVAVLSDIGGATEVSVSADLTITGRPAQFGRGLVAEVSERLIGQFAGNLARELEAGQEPGEGEGAGGSEPREREPRERERREPPIAPASQACRTSGVPAGDSLDLLRVAGVPVARRLIPVLAALTAVSAIVLARRALRRRA